jgi:hypothetical protein
LERRRSGGPCEVREELFIGEWVPARTGNRLTTVDPATGVTPDDHGKEFFR